MFQANFTDRGERVYNDGGVMKSRRLWLLIAALIALCYWIDLAGGQPTGRSLYYLTVQFLKAGILFIGLVGALALLERLFELSKHR